VIDENGRRPRRFHVVEPAQLASALGFIVHRADHPAIDNGEADRHQPHRCVNAHRGQSGNPCLLQRVSDPGLLHYQIIAASLGDCLATRMIPPQRDGEPRVP